MSRVVMFYVATVNNVFSAIASTTFCAEVEEPRICVAAALSDRRLEAHLPFLRQALWRPRRLDLMGERLAVVTQMGFFMNFLILGSFL